MELTNGFIEFFSDKEFAIPLGQVVIFVIINSFCLLFGKYKMGLLISYCFVMYWGFIFNQSYFINILGKTSWGDYRYHLCRGCNVYNHHYRIFPA